MQKQNYVTLETSEVIRGKYVRLSELMDTEDRPFVVAVYVTNREKTQVSMLQAIRLGELLYAQELFDRLVWRLHHDCN